MEKMRRIIASIMCACLIAMPVIMKPRPAYAFFNCCPEATIWIATIGSQLTAYVEGWIAEIWVILSDGFAAINTQITANTQSMTETFNYQTQMIAAITRQDETKKAQSKTEPAPSYAITATATSVIATAANISAVNQHNLSLKNTAYNRNLLPESNGSTSVNNIRMLNEHLKSYCGKLDESLGLCTAVDEEKQDRDLRVSTVLNNDVLDGSEFEDAQVLQRTIIGPAAPKPAANDLRNSAGISKLRDKDTFDARKSTANAVFDYLIAMRSPIQDSEIQKWVKDLFNATYGITSNDPNYTSLYEVTRLISTWRFYSPEWIDAINQQKDDVVLTKEWVSVRSQRLYLDWQRQKLQQLLAAAVAAGNATDAETAYKDHFNIYTIK